MKYLTYKCQRVSSSARDIAELHNNIHHRLSIPKDILLQYKFGTKITASKSVLVSNKHNTHYETSYHEVKKLPYIYKKMTELRSLGINSCTSTRNALTSKTDAAQQSSPATTPCRNSHFTSPATHCQPLAGDQFSHRRHERVCPQNSLHLLQCQAG